MRRGTSVFGALPILLLAGLAACGRVPSASQVIEAARAAQAPGADARAVRSFRSEARVEGPTGPFRVTTVSHLDGRARLEMSSGYLGVVGGEEEGWSRGTTGAVEPLDAGGRRFVRGHELHMLAWAPESRLADPAYAGVEEVEGAPVRVVEFTDATGQPLRAYYRLSDGMPVAFRITDPGAGGGATRVLLDEWSQEDGLRLLRSARFVQGEEVFRYRYDRVEVDAATDGDFRRPLP